MTELRNSLRYVQDRRYRSALTDIVNQIDEEVSRLGLEPSANVALMAGIHQIENPNLRHALSTVMSSADSMEVARANLEVWFNNAMGRASASYAGKMKNLSIVVALFFALALNIDTLHIGRALWEDPALREQLSSEANYATQSGDLRTATDSGIADDQFRASGADDETALETRSGPGRRSPTNCRIFRTCACQLAGPFKTSVSVSMTRGAKRPQQYLELFPRQQSRGCWGCWS